VFSRFFGQNGVFISANRIEKFLEYSNRIEDCINWMRNVELPQPFIFVGKGDHM